MKKRNFTLVEIMISVAIISILFSILAFLLKNQIRTVFLGNRALDLQKETQMIMKTFFIDLKKINTQISIDSNGDIVLHGEKYKNMMPSFVKLIDKSSEKPFCEELECFYYALDPIGEKNTLRYFLKDKKLMRQHIKNGVTKENVVSEYVKELYFRKNNEDNKSFSIFVETEFDANIHKKVKESHKQFEMNMRIDNDFVVVKRVVLHED